MWLQVDSLFHKVEKSRLVRISEPPSTLPLSEARSIFSLTPNPPSALRHFPRILSTKKFTKTKNVGEKSKFFDDDDKNNDEDDDDDKDDDDDN